MFFDFFGEMEGDVVLVRFFMNRSCSVSVGKGRGGDRKGCWDYCVLFFSLVKFKLFLVLRDWIFGNIID